MNCTDRPGAGNGGPCISRREWVAGLLLAPLLPSFAAPAESAAPPFSAAIAPGERLPAWTAGTLDIHHLATGRGSATLVVMPDGTSLLIDAGASVSSLDMSAAPRPDASRRPGEWIARYVQRHLLPTGRKGLDYMLVTHLHPDHLGGVNDDLPRSRDGTYRLTGVMDVAEVMPIGMLIDRGYPHYDYPIIEDANFAANYRAFVRSRRRAGLAVEKLIVGRDDQIRAIRQSAHPAPFAIRNVAADGIVWQGAGNKTTSLFPPLATLSRDDMPNENMCSIAIRIGYGPFAYFSGGDLTSYTFDGDRPWRDVLTAAARAVGPVDVATADHHGMFDGISADIVRALRPRSWVIPTWHISHPDMLQLERMLSERLYPGPRDVFATNVMAANELMNRRLLRKLQSTNGHVVIRVAPGGGTFTALVTDNSDENDAIIVRRGPYKALAASAG